MTAIHSPSVPRPLPSHYHLIVRGEPLATSGPVTPRALEVNQAFRDKILAPDFSCVAAKAAMNTSTYALGLYGELGSLEATLALARDLGRFVTDQDAMDSGFTSMIAVFSDPGPMTEAGFEERLWAQLRALHRLDPQPYSEEVSPDPTSQDFGFSFAGRGFFVIGLHPGSSRLARAFPFPALVFNAHRQFRALRETGKFDRMQQTIRARELKLQGHLNPNLANHGEISEARQYSGRAVEPDWVAPFPEAPVSGASSARCPFGFGLQAD